MGISANFDAGHVNRQVKVFEERLHVSILAMLIYLGESLVTYAKDKHNYLDQTGNLTNSIGYVVVRDGRILQTGGLQGGGQSAGMSVAIKMLERSKKGFSLIIVAGMNYAAYVEARGYNVILPAELKAKTEFPRVMNELISKAKKRYGIN